MTKYGAILADPPWSFRTYSGKTTTPHRCVADHYMVMGKKELQGMPIANLALDDAVLFLWAVDSHVDEAIELIGKWGFSYKTIAFVWSKRTINNKPVIGMGYWTRKQTEICLLGTRGRPRRRDKGVRQIIEATRREHSRKPDEQYERIERLVSGPYIELFARQRRAGWDAIGDETEKFGTMP